MVLNYIIGIVITLFGIWMIYRALAPRIKSRQAAAWPTTQAEILESTVEEDRARSATGKANIAFVPFVSYRYVVDGKQYDGNRITVARAGYDFLDASNIREQFKEGEKIPVHYNPANPGDSILKPSATVGMFSRIPGIFVTLVGLILLVYTIITG
jgi:hypothetical protein